MAYALSALFDETVLDKSQFTIFRPENTVAPVDHQLLADMHKATGLDVSDLVQLTPERLTKQWLAARIPFDVKIDDDEHFLDVTRLIRDKYALPHLQWVKEDFEASDANPLAREIEKAEEELGLKPWKPVKSELEEYRAHVSENVAKAIKEEFDGESQPKMDLEVFGVVHQIHRLMELRQDLGMCEFDDDRQRELTQELAVTYLYNRKADELVRQHVDSAIELAIDMESGLEAVPDPRELRQKHIHVSGGQGSGKTQLSRRTLGILRDEDQDYIRINKDMFRPLMLNHMEASEGLDLNDPESRRMYGRVTEDELNMIKDKQWRAVTEYADSGILPQLLIDSTVISNMGHVEALTEDDSKLSLLYVNTPIDEARKRVQQRAVGEGIPGIDTLRESLESEMLSGHSQSAKQVAGLLVHGVGKNIKLKLLDGKSSDRTKPVQMRVELDKGKMDISSAQGVLELLHKSHPKKVATVPTEEDLAAQVAHFEKIASVMGEINFLDPQTRDVVARYDNFQGMRILDQERFDDEFAGTLTEQVTERLDTFFKTQKAHLLRTIAQEQGHVFEKRQSFSDDESLAVVTDKFETEVPQVDASSYVDDDPESRVLEWRHIAKRGKFLDGTFSPWHSKAPDELRLLSARAVTNEWLSDNVVQQVNDQVVGKMKDRESDGSQTVHISHPVKDYTRPGVNINFMVLVYTKELEKRLNADMEARYPDLDIRYADDRPMLALASDKSTRTTASTLTRLTSQPLYDPFIFDEGDLVLFADEHVQAGGVMLAARNATQVRNVDVLGYTALSSHNLGADLRINPHISMALETAIEENAREHGGEPEEFRADLDEALSQSGLDSHTLTNLEGLILIAYLLDGQDEAKLKWFEGVKRQAGLDKQDVRQGLDSLDELLADDSITPQELGEMMREQIDMSRKAVYPSAQLG